MTSELEIVSPKEILRSKAHPLDHLLRQDRLPHVWCSGCGLGSIMNCFLHAIEDQTQAGVIDLVQSAIVSGIGCTGRTAGYVNIDSFHTTHGRAIPFAIGLKLSNPKSFISVFSGDGDLFAIGGNHIIHAARRNVDLMVVCVNNFNYGMTGGQGSPTTPQKAWTSTTQYGNIEPNFNLVDLMASCGTPYVVRWVSGQVRQITNTFKEAITRKGFRFIEIISQCPTTYGRKNRYREGIDMLKMFQEHTSISHGLETKQAKLPDIGVLPETDPNLLIPVGKFVDKQEGISYIDRVQMLRKTAMSGKGIGKSE